ncbi:hypothetical protein LY76DRAFT_593727 [Colletotrichum caudatum]|nr:hypothetical protein LY76DRAFT_593727 [Colletotrichum caudatum]
MALRHHGRRKAVYLMSCWYTRRELALRTALLYSGLVLAQAFSGLIAAGVFSGMSGAAGVAGWQWLFVLKAALSGFFALTAYFILPNYPHSKNGGAMWSMTEDMRRIAVARVEADRVEQPTDSTVWQGLRLALADMKTYIFVSLPPPILLNGTAHARQNAQVFMNIFMTSSYGFNNFFPTMVRGSGMGSSTMALVLTAPPYILGTAVSFGVAWSSDRRKQRGFHIMANNCLSIVGSIISVATLNTAARYAAAFLYTSGSFSANALVGPFHDVTRLWFPFPFFLHHPMSCFRKHGLGAPKKQKRKKERLCVAKPEAFLKGSWSPYNSCSGSLAA